MILSIPYHHFFVSFFIGVTSGISAESTSKSGLMVHGPKRWARASFSRRLELLLGAFGHGVADEFAVGLAKWIRTAHQRDAELVSNLTQSLGLPIECE